MDEAARLSFEDFKKIDLRVAEIVEAREHPDADKLYLLKVDLGDEQRQIVAGIRTAYDAGELTGKKIVLVANLEPAVIRGEESNGMLLAAKDGDLPVLLTPERDVSPGSGIG
ncbi:MAG: methionine--tRNA ligase subunit beta [Candidatus Omnitrophica bacterium]|nr:methionine--tRNA ligase subunit beta [Candidatus Omnitrophota bacterium]